MFRPAWISRGTLDIWPVHLALPAPAVTVNVALDIPATVEIHARSAGDMGIGLRSTDLDLAAVYDSPLALDAALASGTCPLPLLAHAVSLVGPGGGFDVISSAESPAGAGLGGSSALLVALVGSLMVAAGDDPDLQEIQRIAQDIETTLLRMPTGYQDYYPPLLGGALALEGAPGGTVVETLEVHPAAIAARLRLIYTGAPHVSGITNWGVVRAYLEGEARTVDALHALAEISRRQRTAFREGDLDSALACLVEDGAARREMAPGVSTPETDRLDAGVRQAGALGTKICGAGGGGCVMVALAPDAAPGVDAWLASEAARGGSRVLPVELSETGLQLENLGSR